MTAKFMLALGGALVLTACATTKTPQSTNSTTLPISTNPAQEQASSSYSNPSADKHVSVLMLKNMADKELAQELDLGANFHTDAYSVLIGDKLYQSGDIDLSSLGNGLRSYNTVEKASKTANGKTYHAERHGRIMLYQQPNSVVVGTQIFGGHADTQDGDRQLIDAEDLSIEFAKGNTTKVLPKAGSFTYSGRAFSQNSEGNLRYTVDFGKRMGQGTITSDGEMGNITLNAYPIASGTYHNFGKSTLTGFGVRGTAYSQKYGKGEYTLGFFGDHAEEIAGVVSNHVGDIGFGGHR